MGKIKTAGDKPITFELSVAETLPQKLYGDELRVKQILNNLLSNAIKYTKKGSVRLEITCLCEGDTAWLRFSVRDTGIGIRAEDIAKVFKEYSQLDTKVNRKIEGTGLGLSITQQIVTMMNGTVSVESEYGAGTVFVAKIQQGIVDASPIGAQAARTMELFRPLDSGIKDAKPQEHSKLPNARVLLVDDVEINLDVAAGLLEFFGIQADCVLSGKEAIKKVRDGLIPYDMILMDHMMPEMDGIEATRIIRNEIASDYAKTVPIVALTANALEGNKEMFLANGFNDFISKPIDSDLLELVLTKWIIEPS